MSPGFRVDRFLFGQVLSVNNSGPSNHNDIDWIPVCTGLISNVLSVINSEPNNHDIDRIPVCRPTASGM